jgi:glycosyltransferase involved in cell wall biosynthesis
MRKPDFRHETDAHRRPHHAAPDLASVRVIFVVHHNEPKLPGSDSGLGITVNCTMRVLRREGVDAETWSVQTVEQLFHRLEKDQWASVRPITHVVINTPNFANPSQFAQLAQQWPKTDFIMLAHTGLAYLCIDDHGPRKIRELLHLQRAVPNIKVAGNNPRFEWFGIYGQMPLLLPNLYDVESFVAPVSHRANHDPLRIGSFGENRPWKNQSLAAMAALAIARRMGVRLELYVNADRWEQTWPYSQARQELFDGLPWASITKVPWDTWSRFREIVGTMDLCIHPSYDETFCVVCADGIAEGVPSVVTGAMEWAPRSWQCSEPYDPMNIATVGMALLHSRDMAVHDGRVALTSFVKSGVMRWLEYLTA